MWLAALIGAGGLAAIYLAGQRNAGRRSEQQRHELEARLESMARRLAALETASAAGKVAGPEAEAAGPVAPPVTTTGMEQEVSPDTLLVIAAAVTAFLGKRVRVRSARLLHNPEVYSAWAQQGRVFVQASHNVAQRSR